MRDDDPLPAKEISLEVVVDSGVLSCLDDERLCDLFELLCAEVLFRFVMTPPDRCGLCMRSALSKRLCARHHALLTQALDLFSSGDIPNSPSASGK
jgi:hypothetical protein